MIEISKELLSEVLDIEVTNIRSTSYPNCLCYETANEEVRKHFSPTLPVINVYELAHKCKEWANYYGFFLYPARAFEYTFVRYGCAIMKPKYNAGSFVGLFGVDKYDERDYLADTEIEAIIKASEWILKEIKK